MAFVVALATRVHGVVRTFGKAVLALAVVGDYGAVDSTVKAVSS